MKYLKVSEAAEKWGISARRVRLLCAEKRIEGVVRRGNLYMIPENVSRPADNRLMNGKSFVSSCSKLLLNVDAKKAELDRLRPLTSGEVDRLRKDFLAEFTYNSNAIEGNTLTLKETAMVLEGITVDAKPLKDHLEAVGHRDAFLYIEDAVSKGSVISVALIKNTHSLVLIDRPEDKGIFRRIPVKIIGAFTEPVQPYLIEQKLTDLLFENEKRKKKMHPIERIARFHLEFEGIHPFIDGNGRTGRLLMNMDLIQTGYTPIDIKFSDRKKYYDAFDTYFRDNNDDAMTGLIAGYINDRLDYYLKILEQSR